MCRIPTQTYWKIVLLMCVQCTCVVHPCNIYVALFVRWAKGALLRPRVGKKIDSSFDPWYYSTPSTMLF